MRRYDIWMPLEAEQALLESGSYPHFDIKEVDVSGDAGRETYKQLQGRV